MDKLFEMLGVEKIDKAKQEELKTTIETLIESKVAEKVEEKLEASLEEAKQLQIEKMEEKFEEYKEDLVEKFSNFVDDIIDEEISLPDNVIEFARLGETYHDLIESFKVKLAIDEGVLDEEVKTLVRESRDEIIDLKKTQDKILAEKMDLEISSTKLMNEHYLMTKCEDLTPKQKKHIKAVLEGANKEEIDKKFDILLSSFTGKSVNEEDEEFETKECPNCGEEIPKDAKKCPECDTNLSKDDDNDDDDKNESRSRSETNDILNENNSLKAQWLKTLQNKKF